MRAWSPRTAMGLAFPKLPVLTQSLTEQTVSCFGQQLWGLPLLTPFCLSWGGSVSSWTYFFPHLPKGSFRMNSFPSVTPTVCRHMEGGRWGIWGSLPGSLTDCAPFAPGNLLAVSFNISGHDYQYCHEISCSHFNYSSFDFLWGSPHPCLVFSWRSFRPHFHLLNVEYYITARVLHGAAPEEASWTESVSSVSLIP